LILPFTTVPSGLVTEPADVLVATHHSTISLLVPNRYMFFLAIVILFSVAPNEALAWCHFFCRLPSLVQYITAQSFHLKMIPVMGMVFG